jgi:hypothetical protein
MRKVSLLVALLFLSLFTVPASADVKPTPSPTSTLSPAAQYEEALQQFKIDMKLFQEARILREQQLRSILVEFNKALRKASEEARMSGKSAGSKATLAAARASAATARDESVALLGPEPVAPTPPPKPAKGAKMFSPSQKPGKKN